MERGMPGNWHVPCGVGEKLEITSNAYLLLTFSLRTNNLKGVKKCYYYGNFRYLFQLRLLWWVLLKRLGYSY